MNTDAIERITKMERCFSLLQQAAQIDPAVLRTHPLLSELLDELTEYFEGGQWLLDYTLDEQKLLPPSLKRGVLSQDAVYNFLQQIHHPDGDGIS